MATFRAAHDSSDDDDIAATRDGMITRDNVYGTLESDAWRRDFTLNALYYNIADFSLVDYTGGLKDLHDGVLHFIGDAETRITEDPVRMLRAVRFASKLEFRIPQELGDHIRNLSERITVVPPARLFDEILKMFLSGHAQRTFELLREFGLFKHLFPETERHIEQDEPFTLPFIRQALINTDQRIIEGKPVTPAFLFAALLWTPVRKMAEEFVEEMSPLQALQAAGDEVSRLQREQITLPRRFQIPMREIWAGQSRLEHRKGKRPLIFAGHPRFRAAYDFMLLRSESGEADPQLADWWTKFQTVDSEQRHRLTKPPKGRGRGRRRRKKRPDH